MQGASPSTVRRAIDERDPFPGGYGFAGEIDGTLVRDVLGRYPLFSEPDDPTAWSADPTELRDPLAVPAGCRRTATGDERLWTVPEPEPCEDDERVIEKLRSAVIDAVDAIEEPIPTAFSGGIDSSILAARLEGPLYVGGFEGSHDVDTARSAVDALDRELTVVEFTHHDIERAVPDIVSATGRRNAMDVAIALPLYLVAEVVSADGHDRLAVGQGADELFGGYAKVAKAPTDPRVEAETVRGAASETIVGLPAQLERDVLTIRAAGLEPVAPLLGDSVVTIALRLPGHLLVDGDERKVALRRSASFLPEPIRSREKKAVQYGSLVSRELDRLARQAGFKRRMDDHVGQYIDSLTRQ